MAVLDRSSADDILTSTLDEMREGLQEQWLSGNPVTKDLPTDRERTSLQNRIAIT